LSFVEAAGKSRKVSVIVFMKYDFDRIISRKNTDAIKYDWIAKQCRPADTIPLWVADMDFPAPPEVLERLKELADHGIFGYCEAGEAYFSAVRNWFDDCFGFRPEPQWLVRVPGVVFALGVAIRGLTAPGDGVLIQEPVYHPFTGMIEANDRRVVNNGLIYRDGRYELDLVDFEAKIVGHRVRLFLLCNPHNPVGRVWTKAELRAMGDICLKHDCLVVSDEIHCDFIRPGRRHLVWAGLSEELAARAIVCTAPSKTFNLAGLQAANIFIPNDKIRAAFQDELHRIGYGELNAMALVAARAAYEHGRDWLDQLRIYLAGNLDLLKTSLANLPGLRVVEPEGTYLVWLDCTGTGLPPEALDDLFSRRARLWLNEGSQFGASGAGFFRLNLACPRALLAEALDRLQKVWPS